jgi:hypothetical protein
LIFVAKACGVGTPDLFICFKPWLSNSEPVNGDSTPRARSSIAFSAGNISLIGPIGLSNGLMGSGRYGPSGPLLGFIRILGVVFSGGSFLSGKGVLSVCSGLFPRSASLISLNYSRLKIKLQGSSRPVFFPHETRRGVEPKFSFVFKGFWKIEENLRNFSLKKILCG